MILLCNQIVLLAGFLTVFSFGSTCASQETLKTLKTLKTFQAKIEPLFENYCYDCHGYGASEGGVVLDEFKSNSIGDHELWLRVLKNTRSHIMPPREDPQPSAAERKLLADWIKTEVFAIDREDPDPGRMIVHRLNRTEYQNTILDLVGVEFKSTDEFPADNTGEGFDNIGELLTLSPMMLEKYLDAKTISFLKPCQDNLRPVSPNRRSGWLNEKTTSGFSLAAFRKKRPRELNTPARS